MLVYILFSIAFVMKNIFGYISLLCLIFDLLNIKEVLLSGMIFFLRVCTEAHEL